MTESDGHANRRGHDAQLGKGHDLSGFKDHLSLLARPSFVKELVNLWQHVEGNRMRIRTGIVSLPLLQLVLQSSNALGSTSGDGLIRRDDDTLQTKSKVKRL